ncbi:MAG: hypothetical protein ACXITV_06470 [Luteibaculaceae bacterium]
MTRGIIMFSFFALIAFAYSCSNKLGERVRDPFTGSKYQSNNRFWRSTGFGSSSDRTISRQRAMLEARRNLAAEINTNLRAVSDQYMKSQQIGDREVNMLNFEQLFREVLDQNIVDVRMHDQRQFQQSDGQIHSYVAMEVRKKHMYRHMRRLANARNYDTPATREFIVNMIDEELQRLEAIDPD